MRSPEIQAAEALLNAGDIAGARKKLAEAQEKDPRLAAPGVILARAYLAQKQVPQARAELEEVVAKSPQDPEPYALLGELAWRERRVAETDLLFRQALACAKGMEGSAERKADAEAQAHAGLATVAEARGQWEAAFEELTAWAALDARNPFPHQRLGAALHHLGKREEAIAEFETAGKLNPDFTAELALATLDEEAGDRKNSAKAIAAAIKRLPDNLALRRAVANFYVESRQVLLARRQIEAALKIDPKSVETLVQAAGIARLEGDDAAAERRLTAVLEQAPTHFAAINLLALTLADQDDAEKQARALELAQQNVEKYPRNSEAIATLGWALLRLARWDDANRVLRQALATGTVNADGAYFLARLFEHLGETGDTKRLLSMALATKRPFAYQAQAEKMLAELNGDGAKEPAPAGPAEKPAATPKAKKAK